MKNSLTKCLTFVTVLALSLSASGDAWYNKAWPHRLGLSLSSELATSEQPDFPVLLVLERTSLKSAANGGNIGNDRAGDVIFTASDGTTRLNHEVEDYDPETGRLTAWVRMPLLSDSEDMHIYMYYGQPEGRTGGNTASVWDENYLAVLHLADDPSGTAPQLRDSSSRGRHGTTYGSMNPEDLVDTKIGKGLSLDGVNDSFSFPGGATGSEPAWTIEMWVFMNEFSGEVGMINRGLDFRQYAASNGQLGMRNETASGSYKDVVSSYKMAAQVWNHVVYTYDANSNLCLYVNGVLQQQWQNEYIKFSASRGYRFSGVAQGQGSYKVVNGYVDEVRLSAIARNADWVATSFRNQNHPTAYWTVGEEETAKDTTRWSSIWNRRFSIAIPSENIAGTLPNFPVLVQLKRDDLRSVTFGGFVGQEDGADIRFTATDGVTKIPHEIDSYDPEEGLLLAWVNPGLLDAESEYAATFYIYYGHATCDPQAEPHGVWDADFLTVQHMSGDPSGEAPQLLDSTSNQRNGNAYGDMTSDNLVEGKIGRGLRFNGSPERASIGSVPTKNTWTTEIWFSIDSAEVNGLIGRSTDFRHYINATPTPYSRFLLTDGVTYVNLYTTVTVKRETWHQLVWSLDAEDTLRVYYNGKLDKTFTNSPVHFASSRTYQLAGGSNLTYMKGMLDEFRISGIARSTEWIETSYTNQNEPEMFLLAGYEQSYVPSGTVLLLR